MASWIGLRYGVRGGSTWFTQSFDVERGDSNVASETLLGTICIAKEAFLEVKTSDFIGCLAIEIWVPS